jgi:hypothetical protein
MDNETIDNPDSNARTKTPVYGNLEITIENSTQEQLDQLLEFIIAKVEEMHLVMVGRTYMTTDEDYEDSDDAEEPESTPQG